MELSDKTKAKLHHKLPIDDDEKVLAVFRHHWFAYAASWITAGIIVIVIMAIAVALTSIGGTDGTLSAHRSQIIAGAGVFSLLVLLGAGLPVYLRSQEQLVLTEESLLQVLQPSLFASKVDSVGLGRIDDVSVRQTFLGTIFGFGHMTVETPGEQDNYEFYILPDPHNAAREISQAHENFEAALNAGRMPTTLGQEQIAAAPAIDPQQYQQFLQYQQMLAQQQAGQPAPQTPVPQNASQQPAPNQETPLPQQPAVPAAPAQQPSYPPDASTNQ